MERITFYRKLSNVVHWAFQHYQQLLNIHPRRTKLQILSGNQWEHFCERLNFDAGSKGIFLSRNLTAYLLEDSEFLQLNLFHEYFGHGLFYEYSKQGKFMEKLERRLAKEEKRFFGRRRFTLEELLKFREQNPYFKLVQKVRNDSLYETFAIWTEYYLSELFDIKDEFEQKYSQMPEEARESLEQFISFQKDYGDLALFYHLGFPKYYDAKKVKQLLTGIFKDKINSAKLIVLYGSRRPYSDIDLFVVSKEIKDFRNDWLDVYSLTPDEFEYSVSVFRISVTDPLLTGELVLGDENYFEQKRKQLQEQPITQEAIYYNLIKSKEQKRMARQFPRNSKEYQIGMGYAETYLKNAIALKQGKRKLTRKSLIR